MHRAVMPMRDVLCYRALRKLIRQIRPNVAHTHSSKAGILGRAAAWAEQVPCVVHTVHGLPFHERQSRWKNRLYIALERWAAGRCHHLVAVTPAMVDAFVAAGIASRDRFTVIAAGVDLSCFDVDREHGHVRGASVRDELGIPQDARVIGIVARIDPLKGHDDLLDILPELPNAHLVCIGDGFGRAHLQQRIATEGLADRVTLTGLVPREAVGRLFSAIDVHVLPSYQEGQSLTLIEALLAGCAIVAYNAGGIGSICKDGETGKLVPVGDKAKLRDAIAWMFDHRDEAAAMTRRGREHVRRNFNADQMVKMIEQLYCSTNTKGT
jgi:glycosyltransferase involved in cell wall biosynthesis